jgi:hypothetical protein
MKRASLAIALVALLALSSPVWAQPGHGNGNGPGENGNGPGNGAGNGNGQGNAGGPGNNGGPGNGGPGNGHGPGNAGGPATPGGPGNVGGPGNPLNPGNGAGLVPPAPNSNGNGQGNGRGNANAPVAAELSENDALAAVESGRAVELTTILPDVRTRTGGEVINAQLQQVGTFLIYAVTVLTPSGQVITEHYYARSGAHVGN